MNVANFVRFSCAALALGGLAAFTSLPIAAADTEEAQTGQEGSAIPGMTQGTHQQRNTKLRAGDQAVLYSTINENEQMVDMAPMIDGRPLVLVTGSAT